MTTTPESSGSHRFSARLDRQNMVEDLAVLADAGATPEADALRDLVASAGDPLGSDR
jgi:hypothetical protein